MILGGPAQLQYATLAFGSALALFLYPHSLTGVFAANSRDTIKRNMAALPAYSFVLGLLALLGYMAIAAGVKPLVGENGRADGNTVVPLLFEQQFPSWFAGVAFAAIGIGALVPAAIMSIAAANLWTRNIYKEYLNKDATPKQEARSSKLASLVVKVGALLAILGLDPQFSHRPAAHRRRGHAADAAGGRAAGCTPAASTQGAHRRLGGRHGRRLLDAVPDPAARASGPTARSRSSRSTSAGRPSRCPSSASTPAPRSTRACSRSRANLLVASSARCSLRGRVDDGEDTTKPSHYTAEAGDPGVKDLTQLMH